MAAASAVIGSVALWKFTKVTIIVVFFSFFKARVASAVNVWKLSFVLLLHNMLLILVNGKHL